jgi:hypothetical protein
MGGEEEVAPCMAQRIAVVKAWLRVWFFGAGGGGFSFLDSEECSLV